MTTPWKKTTFKKPCLIRVKYPPLTTKRPFDVSRGNFSMAMDLYRYNLKRIPKRWQSKNAINSMGLLFSVEFIKVIFSLSYFFILRVDYWFLLLTADTFCTLLKKDKKMRKKRWGILKKMNSLKKGKGSTFKLWGESQGPRSRVLGPVGVLVTFVHHALEFRGNTRTLIWLASFRSFDSCTILENSIY